MSMSIVDTDVMMGLITVRYTQGSDVYGIPSQWRLVVITRTRPPYEPDLHV